MTADGLRGRSSSCRMRTSGAQQYRPELMRTVVLTNPHSIPKYRVNNVVANMPEFQQAFSCKAGTPMVRAKQCRVW